MKIIIGHVQYKHNYITRTKNVKIIIGQHVQYKHHYIKRMRSYGYYVAANQVVMMAVECV